MTAMNHDADSTPRSEAWADLGGGAYTLHREGKISGKKSSSSEKPVAKRPVRRSRGPNADAPVLGTTANITAPREQLNNNLDYIRRIRAGEAVASVTVPEEVEVVSEAPEQAAPQQQHLFE